MSAVSGKRVAVGSGHARPGGDGVGWVVGCWCWCGGERASTRSSHGFGRGVGGTLLVVVEGIGSPGLVSYWASFGSASSTYGCYRTMPAFIAA